MPFTSRWLARSAPSAALLSVACAAVLACGGEGSKESGDGSGSTATASAAGTGTGTGTSVASGGGDDCATPAGGPSALETSAQLIEFLNAMPKPVSVACLISALPGPLAVNATASDLSVQPASGHDYPRLFIATGKLILGFGVAGPSAKALEYSELLSDSLSVKGEIPMPVTAELEASTPFDRIRSQTGSGTTCVGCHSGEKAAPASIGATAYSSKALRPMSHQDVSLTELAKLRDAACANTADPRCAVLKALWKAGDPKAYTFPAAMPTMF